MSGEHSAELEGTAAEKAQEIEQLVLVCLAQKLSS
jgi:hypothetical protein